MERARAASVHLLIQAGGEVEAAIRRQRRLRPVVSDLRVRSRKEARPRGDCHILEAEALPLGIPGTGLDGVEVCGVEFTRGGVGLDRVRAVYREAGIESDTKVERLIRSTGVDDQDVLGVRDPPDPSPRDSTRPAVISASTPPLSLLRAMP